MRVHEAAGGTNRMGVPPQVFAMREGTRMRYDLPHPRLAHAVTAYAIYISDDRQPLTNWYLPGQAMISILLDAGPVSVTIRNRTYSEVSQASLYGPTSFAPRTLTQAHEPEIVLARDAGCDLHHAATLPLMWARRSSDWVAWRARPTR